jgi:arsenate reductase
MRILVLCTGNSARSILLEAILNKLGKGRMTAHSAGSHPTGTVNPNALRLLQAKGYDTTGLRSKSWDEFGRDDAPRMDVVITVCGSARDEECPYWPGAPLRAHWGVEDPAAVNGSQAEIDHAFAETYDLLETRAAEFVAGFSPKLSKQELARLLSAVGKTEA